MRPLLAEPSRLNFRRAKWRRGTHGRRKKRNLWVTETRQQRLQHFKTEIYGRVKGRLGDRMWQIVDVIGTIFETNGVRGNIAEFGVHHGLFLFLLNTLRNDDEQFFAIDVFDDQHLNVDASGFDGHRSLAIFLAHLEILAVSQHGFFRVVQRDMTSFSTSEAVKLFGKEGVTVPLDRRWPYYPARLQRFIVGSGNPGARRDRALDDYVSWHWRGVTEGFYRLNSQNRRLDPLLYFQNKLFLTTVSEYGRCLRQFRAAIEGVCGEEYRTDRWKEVEIAGSYCLSFA